MFNRFKRLLLSTAQTVILGLLLAPLVHADENYLNPEEAFKFSASMIDAKTIAVTYAIADGYYMYRDRFKFEAVGAKLGQPVIPGGKVKFDETFQKEVETYHNGITIRLPVETTGAFTLNATGQGCADKGLCYPPQTSTIKLSPDAAGAGISQAGAAAPAATLAPAGSEMGRIEASLKSGKLLVILPLFALLGLGLAFTPCVLPMVPILSCIIVGEGAQVSRSRGFILSATYALGMALVYTALGIAAGLVGEGLAAALQNPLVLGAFALLMVVLSLSMFGVYQLQVPASIQLRLMKVSEKQSSGKYFGVFVMGAVSALIVGPCVAAPLAGALLYISQTRDVVIGGSALFAMALGMSLPLLLVGVSAGALLPRAGAWMEAVKRFFGVLMLAMALWLVSPVIPSWAQMLGWSALGLGSGVYLLLAQGGGKTANGFGLLLAAFGLVQLVGVASGGRDAWAPLAHLSGSGQLKSIAFDRVKSVAELDAALKNSQAQGKIAMLDFYADWCVSCKEMEKFTLSDQRVRAQLSNVHLLQVDVTANDADDKAMLKRFNLFGPPGIIFFDRHGSEINGGRVIGYQDADKFLKSLRRVLPI
jgi:thioredoxin:protein disulfide reductase